MRDDTRFMKKQTLLLQDMLTMLGYLELHHILSQEILQVLKNIEKKSLLPTSEKKKEEVWLDSADTKNYLKISDRSLYRRRKEQTLLWKKNGKYYYEEESVKRLKLIMVSSDRK